MTVPPSAIDHVARKSCPGCAQLVMHVADIDTGEPIVLDPGRVEGGHISVWSLRGHAFARRYGQPARTQPAWDEHRCATPTVLVPQAGGRPVDDPYEDEPAAAQQHGGWRS